MKAGQMVLRALFSISVFSWAPYEHDDDAVVEKRKLRFSAD